MEWNYKEAFSRNIGILSELEQEEISKKHVSIVGMGGVGGIHLYTLARLGVQNFTIADFDNYEVANFNRQFGAMVSNISRPKVEVMAEFVKNINPNANIKLMNCALNENNIDEFFVNSDFFIDGIDAFVLDTRRQLFNKAREKGIWSITAGPIGFGTVWIVFDPKGMSFDEYFNFKDDQDFEDKFAHFLVGLIPKSIQISYLKPQNINIKSKSGPSVGAACNLASGIATIEFVKCMLGKGKSYPAPYFHQFDAFVSKKVKGKLRWGNSGPLQKLKINYVKKHFSR